MQTRRDASPVQQPTRVAHDDDCLFTREHEKTKNPGSSQGRTIMMTTMKLCTSQQTKTKNPGRHHTVVTNSNPLEFIAHDDSVSSMLQKKQKKMEISGSSPPLRTPAPRIQTQPGSGRRRAERNAQCWAWYISTSLNLYFPTKHLKFQCREPFFSSTFCPILMPFRPEIVPPSRPDFTPMHTVPHTPRC